MVQGIDEFIPVDFYIPGCPPRPDAVLNCLLQLQKKIERDRSYKLALDAGDAPIARGGLVATEGRGEMAAPALAQASDRYVEGSRPKAGVEAGGGPARSR